MTRLSVEVDETNIYFDSFSDFMGVIFEPYEKLNKGIIRFIFLFTLYPIMIIITLPISLFHYIFLSFFKIFNFLYKLFTEYIIEFPDTDNLNFILKSIVSILLLPIKLLSIVFGYSFISIFAIISYFAVSITSFLMFIFTSIGYML